MRRIICDICGSQSIIKENGVFVCTECGAQYSLSEAQKLLKEIDTIDSTQVTSAQTKHTYNISDYIIENSVLIKYIGKNRNIVIPDFVDEISNDCFYDNDIIESIEILDGVKKIGNNAFRNATKLKRIVIPKSIKDIGQYAFGGCCELQDIVFSADVHNLRSGLFCCCVNLQRFDVPNSVNTIEDKAFYGCDLLETVLLPDSLTFIGPSAFLGCVSLRNIRIPKNVSMIPDRCFSSCDRLTRVELNEVKCIRPHAFSYCKSLRNIIIPKSVSMIGAHVFEYCYRLIILCEACRKPDDWNKDWNSNNRPVVWGFKDIEIGELTKEKCFDLAKKYISYNMVEKSLEMLKKGSAIGSATCAAALVMAELEPSNDKMLEYIDNDFDKLSSSKYFSFDLLIKDAYSSDCNWLNEYSVEKNIDKKQVTNGEYIIWLLYNKIDVPKPRVDGFLENFKVDNLTKGIESGIELAEDYN